MNDSTAQRTLPLERWADVVSQFRRIFEDLGEVTQSEEQVAFASRPPDVETGLTLRRDGRLAASMPLHGVEARIERLRWDKALTVVELLGAEFSYVYRIPTELLRHRRGPD